MSLGSARGGGFTIHDGGECDVRACYTALAVAHMLNLDVAELVQLSGMVEYVARCQTYEGVRRSTSSVYVCDNASLSDSVISL